MLDPAQNHTFRDHYLDVDLDLSEVLFIATANVAETIPAPLLDRMEVIRIDGYTEEEKVAIARLHLLPRQLERNGLRADEVRIADDALRVVVADYTREAGVRNLERELGKLLRKAATTIASRGASGGASRGEHDTPIVVEADDVRTYLGRPRFFFEVAERTAVPGVATGLAVTGTGGDVLFIEATREEGEATDGFTLTGQLGDVMKESAQIALSYVRSHAAELGIPSERAHGRFRSGMMTSVRPAACAASTFCFNPPIGSTRPCNVTSPVMPTPAFTGRPVTSDANAVVIVMPADGPSLGTAPDGTCRWNFRCSNASVGTCSSSALARTNDSAICADSDITSPS